MSLEAMPATEALADPNPLLRSGERLRLVSLAEEAERIRVSLTAIKAVADEDPATVPRWLLRASAYALADVAGALSARGSRRRRERLRSLARSGERIAAITPPRDAGWRWAAEGLLGQLRSAIRISEQLLGARPPLPPQGQPRRQRRRAQPAAEVRRQPAELRHELLLTLRGCLGSPSETAPGLWHELVTLRACLGLSSEAGRHAVRLGVIAALTELLVRASGLSHGYWAVLTVFIVLRPDYSSTLQRGVQRAGGTVVGAVAQLGGLLSQRDIRDPPQGSGTVRRGSAPGVLAPSRRRGSSPALPRAGGSASPDRRRCVGRPALRRAAEAARDR